MLICLKWSSSTYLPKSFLSSSLKTSFLQDCNKEKEVFLLLSLAMPKLGYFLLYTSFGNTPPASLWTTIEIAFPFSVNTTSSPSRLIKKCFSQDHLCGSYPKRILLQCSSVKFSFLSEKNKENNPHPCKCFIPRVPQLVPFIPSHT